MALPQALRFRGRREVGRVARSGRRAVFPLGRAVISKRGDSSGRVLFVVSKAVAKQSVVRNRIKRRLDGWVGRMRAPLPADVIFFVHRDAATVSSAELLRRAAESFTRLTRMIQR